MTSEYDNSNHLAAEVETALIAQRDIYQAAHDRVVDLWLELSDPVWSRVKLVAEGWLSAGSVVSDMRQLIDEVDHERSKSGRSARGT